MYTAQTTKKRIKAMCKDISMEQMLMDCSLGVNAIRQINDTKGMASFSLAKIADYLDCSVDYLLGRTDNSQSHKIAESVTVDTVTDNHGLIGNTHAPVTINNAAPDKQETALLEVYKRLTPVQQAKLLVYADELRAVKGETK